jgi:hypothetical protein
MSDTAARPKRAYNRRVPPVQAPVVPSSLSEGLVAPPAFAEAQEAAPVAPERPALRPAMREEDPRARAARRTAELRNHLGDADEGADEFYVPGEYVPPGWDYEWKRKTTLGAEDPAYQVSIARKGWEPVPASRHPDMMPMGNGAATIERKGMVLMERPKEISEDSRRQDRIRAQNQVRANKQKLGQTPDGTMSREAHPGVRPSIKEGYAPIAIPGNE